MVRLPLLVCPACGRPLIEREGNGMLAVHVHDEREDPYTGVRTGRCPDGHCNQYVRWDHRMLVCAVVSQICVMDLQIVLDKRGRVRVE